jgi:hypothetical protein
MPPKRRDPTDPLEWLRRARSNLARAKADRTLPEILYVVSSPWKVNTHADPHSSFKNVSTRPWSDPLTIWKTGSKNLSR